jgi:hypothetical protein
VDVKHYFTLIGRIYFDGVREMSAREMDVRRRK